MESRGPPNSETRRNCFHRPGSYWPVRVFVMPADKFFRKYNEMQARNFDRLSILSGGTLFVCSHCQACGYVYAQPVKAVKTASFLNVPHRVTARLMYAALFDVVVTALLPAFSLAITRGEMRSYKSARYILQIPCLSRPHRAASLRVVGIARAAEISRACFV
jgi:hypothetical protein